VRLRARVYFISRKTEREREREKERESVRSSVPLSFFVLLNFVFFFFCFFSEKTQKKRRREIPRPREGEKTKEEGEPISSPRRKKNIERAKKKKIHYIVINTNTLLTYEVKRTKMALTLTASTVVASVKPTVSSNRR